MKFKRRIRASTPEIGTPYQADSGIWRLDNVPICSTGIEYQLGTGPHTFTETELADAVEAASGADIAVNAPRIKLGHKSKANDLFVGEDEPAFGRVENLRLSANKQTVIGDYVGTPEWLAKVLPVAFPSRSVDAAIGVETATGKKYEMVITDVSLLGIKWPGCSVLEDLPLWYGAQVPADAEIDRVAAAVAVTSIRRQFYKDGPGKVNDRWWIRGERFSTDEGYNLIVDEGDGNISRIPVEVDGDEVRFGDPVQVVEQYPDKAVAAQAVLAGMRMADPAMVIHADRADTAPDNPTQGEAMDEELRLALAKRLGLPDDATEEQIKAELAKPVETPPGDPPTPPDPEPDPPAVIPATATAVEPLIAADGTVQLDRSTYDNLMRGATLAATHETERVGARITETIEAAVKDGRIPPARREHWKKALEADFDGNSAVLDGLEKGLVPLDARGSMGPGGDGEGIQPGQSGEGLPESWFPEIATIRAQAASGRPVVNAKEG